MTSESIVRSASDTDDGAPDTASHVVARTSMEESVNYRLSRLARARRDRWANELRSLGLTPPQAAIMRATKDNPSQGLRALARTLKFDAMAVKRCVDELEAREWVTTAAHEGDRRVRVVSLTCAGGALVSRLDEFVHHQESELRTQLSRAQLDVFSALLARLERAEGIGSDNEESDNEESDNEESDNEESDNEESDNEESDNEESDNEESDNEESDNEESDNEESDNEESDNEESDNEKSEAH